MKKFLWLIVLLFAPLAVNAETFLVQMTRFTTFEPQDITINVGDTVIWTNVVTTAHDTVAFDGTWKSDLYKRPGTFSLTFTAPGFHDYFCTPHLNAGMIGSVTVLGPANTAPTVSISAPANNAAFLTTDTINVQAVPVDDSGSVSQVDLLVNDQVVQTKNAGPYLFPLTLPAGAYRLSAKATDAGGLSATSEPVAITVAAPNLPPTISLDSPADNLVLTAPANFAIEATATDDREVDHVEFFVNDISVGSDNTQPYSIPQTLGAGTYRIRATAFDKDGLSVTSGEISIRVNEPAPEDPIVSIISPLQEAYVTFQNNSAADIVLIARATDPDGTVASVRFNRGAALLGDAVPDPRTNTFRLTTPLPEGRITVTARVTDNQGRATSSDPVSFTVALQPKFTSRTLLPSGVMRLSVFGTSGVPFIFDYSEGMISWTPFLTNSLVRRILFFDDLTAAGSANRSYRARSLDTLP